MVGPQRQYDVKPLIAFKKKVQKKNSTLRRASPIHTVV